MPCFLDKLTETKILTMNVDLEESKMVNISYRKQIVLILHESDVYENHTPNVQIQILKFQDAIEVFT